MKYFLIILILIFSASIFSGCGKKAKESTEAVVEQATGLEAVEKKKEADKDIAVIKAKAIFNQKITEGQDLNNGPCLSNDLMPDWVADVAHNPRQAIDNLPENQCSAYREGKANHFVELDSDGNLIKAQ